MSSATVATTPRSAPAMQSNPAAAAAAVAAFAADAKSSSTCSTPSLAQILTAFEKDGNGDVQLLKSILKAKESEDARLTAEHALHTEQLKVQHTIVVSQLQLYYAQLQAQQQHYAAAAAQAQVAQPPKPYAPYSPTSPPAESLLHPCPPGHPAYGLSPRSSISASPPPAGPDSLKRSRSTSNVSSSASSVASISSASNKKAKLSPPAATGKASKPSHTDVMAALRQKCERNQATNGWAKKQQQQHAAMLPPASQSARSPLPPAANLNVPTSLPLPLQRYTAHVRPAVEVERTPVADQTSNQERKGASSFSMLLNASEAIAAGAA